MGLISEHLQRITNAGRGELAVNQLLDLQSAFGIPHFQRGSVWNTDSISLLLESVFYGTPCGSILLWVPRHPEKEGIPFVPGQRATHFLIDGQQRVRSLIKVFGSSAQQAGGDDDDDNTPADTSGGRKHLWCLNLARINDLDGIIQPDFIEYPLFMYLQDPRSTRSRYRYNLVPLSVLVSGEVNADRWGDLRAVTSRQDTLAESLARIDLPRQCRQMLEQLFDIKVFTETSLRYQLAEVINMYNRINSAGIRVEAEERAYAALAGVYPGIGTWLQDLFTFVEGAGTHTSDSLRLRDDGLRRRKEARFGFKMYMRVLLQAYNYHKSSSFGPNNLSFENLMTFAEEIANKEKKASADQVFADAAFAVRAAVQILRDVLYCDDLRFVPDAASLQPFFLLMFKYFAPRAGQATASLDDHRGLLGFVILGMMLEQLPQENIRAMLEEMDESSSIRQCITAIRQRWPVSYKGLLTSLRETSTVQNRYTLVLYWLLRKNGARDFSYELQFPDAYDTIAELRKNILEGSLDTSFTPEKQHLIPIEVLKGCYADLRKKGSRISDHISNNIGNITYISSALNSFDGGVGAQPLVLMGEDEANLQSHYLLGPRRVVLTGYNDILRTAPELQRALFEKWIEKRTDLICIGLISWLTKLRESSCPSVRIEPRPREFSAAFADAIRRFDLDDDLEDVVIASIEKESRFSLRTHKAVFEDSKNRFALGFESTEHKRDLVVLSITLTPQRVSLDFGKAPKTLEELARQTVLSMPAGEDTLSWTRGSKTQDRDRESVLMALEFMARSPLKGGTAASSV